MIAILFNNNNNAESRNLSYINSYLNQMNKEENTNEYLNKKISDKLAEYNNYYEFINFIYYKLFLSSKDRIMSYIVLLTECISNNRLQDFQKKGFMEASVKSIVKISELVKDV